VLLDRLLESVGLDLQPFAVCDVRQGVGIALPAAREVQVHYTIRGAGELTDERGARVSLSAVSIAIIPPGLACEIDPEGGCARRLAVGPSSTSDHVATVVAGGGDPGVLLLCARMRALSGGALALFDHLRGPLVVDLAEDTRARPVFDALIEEQRSRLPGSRLMTELMLQQCLLHGLRRLCDADPCPLPWLWAFRDTGLSGALAAILRTPAAPHSMRSLAAAAGMSRNVFASRFAQAFGRAPMELVKQVRIGEAIRLLRTTDLTVEVVAARVGFSSRALFSRELAAALGQAPGWPSLGTAHDPRSTRGRAYPTRRRRAGDPPARGSA
jgi:AraC family transcriptional regulator, activator of mtrCDE